MTVLPAAMAPGMTAVGKLAGLSTPNRQAWSTFLPMASTSSGRISSHSGIDVSSTTALGIGTSTASSSAVICS